MHTASLQVFRGLCQLSLTVLFAIATALPLQSQEFRIANINTNAFPVIEASFIAKNINGEKIYNSTSEDFTVTEGNNKNRILEVSNPTLNYSPVSLVLVVDISLSMEGRRLKLAKEGILDLLEQLPLDASEVALVGFSDEAYVFSDFTQNKARLVYALNRMQNINGTSFNNAFLDKSQGSIALSRSALNKKVIIFISDGLGNTSDEEIAAMANAQNASVYCLNLMLPAPADLKKIAQQTQGGYFEKINNLGEFSSAVSSIFDVLKCTEFGKIKWLSNLDCNSTKQVKLQYRKTVLEFGYDVPSEYVGIIDPYPSQLSFGQMKPGSSQNQQLQIISRHIPATIRDISFLQGSSFNLTDTIKFPIFLKPDEPMKINVRYSASDAGFNTGTIKIASKECPDVRVNVIGGGQEQIKLLFPKGGETFSAGSDTSVVWEGVKKSQPVAVSYRLKLGQSWVPVANGSSLRYLWTLPADTSRSVQIRLQPIRHEEENMEISASMDAATRPYNSMLYAADGQKIIATDTDGKTSIWNSENGKIQHTLDGFDTRYSVLTTDNKQVLLFGRDEIFQWDLAGNKTITRISKIGKKVYTSLVLPDNTEQLIPGNVVTDPAKNVRLWSVLTPRKKFLFNEPSVKWASYTADGNFAVTLDAKNQVKIFRTDSSKCMHTIPFSETVNSLTINPNGKSFLVCFNKYMIMIDILTGKELYRLLNLEYEKYTPSGKLLIVKDNDYNLKFVDSYTGKILLSVKSPRYFLCSPSSEYIIMNQYDTLSLYSTNSQKHITKIPEKTIKLASFLKNEQLVIVLSFQNTLEIYDTSTGSHVGTLEGFSRKITKLASNPLKTQFAAIMDDNRIEIWSPGEPNPQQEAVSGNFSIISPDIKVTDTIAFDQTPVNGQVEKTDLQFVDNPTHYPVRILKTEVSGENAAEFEVVSKDFPINLEAGSSLSQEFRFKPEAAGMRKAILKTTTSAQTYSTVIYGKGTTNLTSLITKHLDFGQVPVGSHKDTLAPVLINRSNAPLEWTGIQIQGPDIQQFKIIPNSSHNKVSPHDTLYALIRFTPELRGKTTTAMVVHLKDMDSQRIIVRGEGTATREVIISGFTLNQKDSSVITALVRCLDLESNRELKNENSEYPGKFQIRLHADRNYGLIAEKDNFISTSVNVDLSNSMPHDTIHQNIYLTEIKPGAIIRLNCIFFAFDKSEILMSSHADLNRMLKILKSRENIQVEIRGHTDSIGSHPYNMDLSRARATAVMKYFISNGFSPARISIKYFGETEPVTTNETEEGRALNRRVELKILH